MQNYPPINMGKPVFGNFKNVPETPSKYIAAFPLTESVII
jgi:hypothetical protein